VFIFFSAPEKMKRCTYCCQQQSPDNFLPLERHMLLLVTSLPQDL